VDQPAKLPPPKLPKGTDKGATKDFNKAWNAMIDRLENSECAALFGGKDKALEALQKANFSYQDLGHATQDADGRIHVVGAGTTGNTVFLNTWGPFRNTSIVVNTPSGSDIKTVDFGAGIKSGSEFGSLLLLHELGHLTRDVSGFLPDAGADKETLNRAQKVLDACFKK
jgi:hypothetical protein